MSQSNGHSSVGELALSGRQHQHILFVLYDLAEVLSEIRHHTSATSIESALERAVDDLPASFRRAAAPQLATLTLHLNELVARLHPPPAPASLRRTVHDKLHHCLFDLLDAGSHGLRGYGPIDSETSAELDRLLAQLRGPVEQLLALVEPEARLPGASRGQLAPGVPGSQAWTSGVVRVSTRPNGGKKPRKHC